MLKKLFKYEMKSTARLFLLMYTVVVGLSVLFKLSNIIAEKLNIITAPSVVLLIIYIVSFIVLFVTTAVVLIRRFYVNLVADEGYLSFTLPVKAWEHVAVKTFTAVIWTAASIIVGLISVFIAVYFTGLEKIVSDFFTVIVPSFEMRFGINFYVFVLRTALLLIVYCISGYLMIYCAISIGQLFRSHRIIGAIAAYYGLYIINQIISALIMVIFSSANQNIWARFADNDLGAVSAWLFPIIGVFALAMCAVYFAVSSYILKTRLNLE